MIRIVLKDLPSIRERMLAVKKSSPTDTITRVIFEDWHYLSPVFEELHIWMTENCKGKWAHEYIWCPEHHNILSPYNHAVGIRFEEDKDGIFFKLRWA